MKSALFLLLTACLPLWGATHNVRDLGARGDGTNFDTTAIQAALDACADAGGTVEFPAGTYLCQPVKLHSHTTLLLDAGAVLQASTNQMDFMRTPGDWVKTRGGFYPLIGGQDLTDVTFTGAGVIDGGGQVWWGEAEKARRIRPGYTLPRPVLISLERCKNVRLENITLQNSPKFHLVPTDCVGLIVSNVTILAPEHTANTDAMDPSGRHILITKCKLDVGDDDVAIKAGAKPADGGFESEDITISDCTVLHGHGISIGSETAGGVRNVTVKNCTFHDTDNGLRIKSDIRRGGLVENIRFENITMSNVSPAISFTCAYQGISSSDTGTVRQTSSTAPKKLPAFHDIQVLNLTATCPKTAGLLQGLPESCISNVVFENVAISAPRGFAISHARGIVFTNSTVRVQEGPRLVTEDAEVAGLAEGQ